MKHDLDRARQLVKESGYDGRPIVVIHVTDQSNIGGAGPVTHAGLNAWFGWPDVPQIAKLITDWVRATDQTRRKQLAEEIQTVALGEAMYVPWGEWFAPTAFRKEVQGVLRFTAPVFWNVKIA